MRLAIGYLTRLVVVVSYVTIAVHALVTLWQRGDVLIAIGAVILSPVALIVWPLFARGAVFLGIPTHISLTTN